MRSILHEKTKAETNFIAQYKMLWGQITENSSGGQVVRASAFEATDLSLIPSRVKPMTLKLVLTASLLDVSALKGQCGGITGKFTSCDGGTSI